MSQIVKLNLHPTIEGKLYLGADMRRVVHVFPDISSNRKTELSMLRRELAARMGREAEYDAYLITTTDGVQFIKDTGKALALEF